MFKKVAFVTLPILVFSLSFNNPAHSDSSKAIILSMHNKVQAKSVVDPVWQMAHIDKNLSGGDSIRTGVASRVEVKYSDGTITRLGPNSVMRINQDSSPKRTGIRLLLGKLWLKVTKGNGLLKIQTPTAVASVLGTELFVSNDEKNVSHVTTLEGLVEVTDNQGDKTLVKPGEWVEIAPGKKMETPTPFDWVSLKKNERFMLDPDFMPSVNDFQEDNSWK
jgi:ferric-dicitrate binding protein FerR (iron transport regulator)